MKKIIIVAPSLAMGGIERSSVNIANGLAKLGIKVYFISLFKKEHFYLLDRNISFYEPSSFNAKSLNFLKSILWIRHIVGNLQPHSILVFNKFYGAITSLSLLGNKVPLIISERSSPLYSWPKKISFMNKLAYDIRPPQGVIAQTNIAKIHQKKYYSKNTTITVIPNALREVNLYPQINRKKIILAVGRLNDHLKGFDRLIDAFALIKNQEWTLVFVGGDVEGAKLRKQASDLGIAKRINFLGKVKDIDRIYANAGIFVIPSRSEGFPNALAEAMAAGLPCIAFDFISGPRDIIEEGINGIIVENGNIKGLAKAIDSLIENEDLRFSLGLNAGNLRHRLRSDKISRKFLDFLNTHERRN